MNIFTLFCLESSNDEDDMIEITMEMIIFTTDLEHTVFSSFVFFFILRRLQVMEVIVLLPVCSVSATQLIQSHLSLVKCSVVKCKKNTTTKILKLVLHVYLHFQKANSYHYVHIKNNNNLHLLKIITICIYQMQRIK